MGMQLSHTLRKGNWEHSVEKIGLKRDERIEGWKNKIMKNSIIFTLC
jgi:hypothetical protein